jgi:Fic family protein
MPKQIPTGELDAIADVVAGHADGVGVDGIREGLSFGLPARTLQRRLNQLERDGRVRSTGSGKGARYFPATPAGGGAVVQPAPVGVIKVSTRDGDWLGPEAKEIRRLVTLPPSKRRPVGYDPSFLTSYEPNVTYYLPLAARERLTEMGQVGITDLPAGTYLRQILDRLLIDLAWNSSRLEGNTYSLLETQRLLELGESAEGKATQEAQMILNHKAAIEMLADPTEEIGFNRYTICNLHALLSDNLLSDPAACGRLRSRPVGISGTVFHPLEVPQQIEENFLLILSKASAIEDPFEAAFFVMVHLPYLQAFENVNKRVSRLAANIPMIRHNLCPLSFVDVDADDYVNALIGVYELNRIEYLRYVFVGAYTRSAQRYNAVRQSLGDPDPFRLKYRSQIGRFVREVVQAGRTATKAAQWIRQHAAAEVPEEDRAKFIETVEVELLSLHEGNIARYRLRPGEFAKWKSIQKS